MAIRLKGATPKAGQPDRRAYQIDVQEGYRRVRLSSGTRDRKLALRKEQQVIDALRDNPEVSDDDLRVLVRGRQRAEAIATKALKGTHRTLLDAFRAMEEGPWAHLLSFDTMQINAKVVMRFLPGTTMLAAIDQRTVDRLAEDMRGAKMAPATINRKMQALLTTLRHEAKEGRYPARIPEWRPVSERQFARKYTMSPEDENLVLGNLLKWDSLPEATVGGRPRKRDAADYHDLFVFLADVGCRLGQAFKLRWGDITKDLDGTTLVRFWRTEELKGGMERTIPCTKRAAALLERRRKPLGDQAGPFTHMDKARANKLWTYAKKGTHLESEKDCVIHSLRHTCATRLLELTGDLKLVQEWLGHTSIMTTSNVYAKVLVRRKKAALVGLDKIHEPAL